MFDFLTELAENNNKEWFDAHKTQYESATRIISYASFFLTLLPKLSLQISMENSSFTDKFGIS